MKLIKPLVIVEDDLDMVMPNGLKMYEHMAKKIELFARKCYKSEGRMTNESWKTFLKGIFATKRHTGIAEHRTVSVTFITDRGVSHESVRHRMAAYLQESTRYCDYAKEGDQAHGVTYILPPWIEAKPHGVSDADRWEFICDLKADDSRYAKYIAKGWRPEQARYWLPQGVKTEYAASLNLGSWWNFFMKRTPESAHPQMRQLAIPLLRYFQRRLPQFFDSIPMPEGAAHASTLDDADFPLTEGSEGFKFTHKGQRYDEARLVVNPFYDQVEFEEVYRG